MDLLRNDATTRLRGPHVLPSHDTLWRFCDQADLGRVSKAGAVNRAMIARAWEAGAAPPPGILTIDADATVVATYGKGKQASTFSYHNGQVGLHPLVGIFAETGEVCAVRGRAGNANAGRALGSFVAECVAAIPAGRRGDYQIWVRSDSAGYTADLIEACERYGGWFTITAKNYRRNGPRSSVWRPIRPPSGSAPRVASGVAAAGSPRPSSSSLAARYA